MAIQFGPKPKESLITRINAIIERPFRKVRTRKQAGKYGFFMGLGLVALSSLFHFPTVPGLCVISGFMILELDVGVASMYLLTLVLPKKLRGRIEFGPKFEACVSSLLATTVVLVW